MKWGKRKARPQATGNGRHGGQTAESPEAQAARKEARRQKLKRAAKIGAAVAATALAAYGAKKMSDVLKDKAYSKAILRGQKAIKEYDILATRDALNSTYNPAKRIGETTDRVRKMGEANFREGIKASRNTATAVKELLRKDPDTASTIRELAELADLITPVPRATVSRAKVRRASW